VKYEVYYKNSKYLYITSDFDKACELLRKCWSYDDQAFIMTEDSQVIGNEEEIEGWRTTLERVAAWKPHIK